jgi:uncharacterized protein
MSLLRYAIWFLLGWLIFYFVKRLLSPPKAAPKAPHKPPIANMVRCAQCGLHVPQQEAIQNGDRYYCCKEHQTNDHTPH